MKIDNVSFLRRVIAVDAIVTGTMALLFVFAAQPLSQLLGLSISLLSIVGLLLLPFVVWVGWLALQANPPRKMVWVLIASNAVWFADSFLLVFSGWVQTTSLGTDFIVMQAVMTGLLVALEYVAMRRTTMAVA